MSFFKWLEELFSPAKKQEPKVDTPKPVDVPKQEPPVVTKPIEPPKPVETPKPVEAAKPVPKPIETPKPKPSAPAKVDPITAKPAKIAIIVGHTPKSQGAVNYKNESEFVFNSRIAQKVKSLIEKKYPNKKVKIFFREEGYYSTAVTKVGAEVGKFKSQISLELHFNSFNKVAYGCEILVWAGSKFFNETVKLADGITDRMALKFNLKERNVNKYSNGTYGDGIKILASKDRGALNIKACNDNNVKFAMLIEPCFANISTAESKAIFDHEDKYAEFLAEELSKIDV